MESDVYSAKLIKSIPWIVVNRAIGDQVHPFLEWCIYSTREIEFISLRMMHIELEI